MKMIKRQRTRGRKAQGLLEFALIMPVLLLLLMGTIEFGWLIFNYTQVYNGLREGLRYGSVPSFSTTPSYANCSGIRSAVEGTAPQLGISDSEIFINYDQNQYGTNIGSCTTSGGYSLNAGYTMAAGDRVVITITHTVNFLTPFLR